MSVSSVLTETPAQVSLFDYVPGTSLTWEDVLPDPAASFEERVVEQLAIRQALEQLGPLSRALLERLYLGPEELDAEDQLLVLIDLAREFRLPFNRVQWQHQLALHHLELLLNDAFVPEPVRPAGPAVPASGAAHR